ncbi:MAG TPA: acyl carrier protein [Dokdonella sp.]|uniref:acyl carrier protein n=1 Tax=Dokdonella sp. TaxID=2291710 RepID=UPI002D807BC9|nr:acyl carrier protein [Dokdonella sp.]HET9032239.1 acyl carrier protein [Dokdonella sp.]
MQTIEARIRDFVRDTFPSEDHDNLALEQSLFDAGILDSIGVLSLVTWLESEFEIIVDDDDVIPENIDGIGPLVRYVESKHAEARLAG